VPTFVEGPASSAAMSGARGGGAPIGRRRDPRSSALFLPPPPPLAAHARRFRVCRVWCSVVKQSEASGRTRLGPRPTLAAACCITYVAAWAADAAHWLTRGGGERGPPARGRVRRVLGRRRWQSARPVTADGSGWGVEFGAAGGATRSRRARSWERGTRADRLRTDRRSRGAAARQTLRAGRGGGGVTGERGGETAPLPL